MGFQSGPQTVYTVGAGNLAANLLVKMAGDGTAIANTATPADLAVGVTYQAGLIGASIPITGIGYGIISVMAAAVAIAVNDVVYAAAAGTVTNVAGGRAIGIAKTAGNATVIDIIPMPLLLTAAALAAASSFGLLLSAGTAVSLGSAVSNHIWLCSSTFTGQYDAAGVLDANFQTLARQVNQIRADVTDLRTKLQTTLIVG